MTTPSQFVQTRTEQGMQTVDAVCELAHALCITERQAWKLYTGTGTTRKQHILLLTVYETAPHLRHLWTT